MTDYRERLLLENLVSETFLSATKSIPSLPPDDIDDDDEIDTLSTDDDQEESPEEGSAHSFSISIPLDKEEKSEDNKLVCKNLMTARDCAASLKNLTSARSFEDVFEPWMIEKIAVASDALQTVYNSAKFNSLDTAD